MNITKTTLDWYRQKKIPSLCGKSDKYVITIHSVLNAQFNYDPFDMKKRGTNHHNAINLLGLSYRSYKKGYKSKTDFIDQLNRNKYLAKYASKFN